jgi:hypothetical protein
MRENSGNCSQECKKTYLNPDHAYSDEALKENDLCLGVTLSLSTLTALRKN